VEYDISLDFMTEAASTLEEFENTGFSFSWGLKNILKTEIFVRGWHHGNHGIFLIVFPETQIQKDW